MIDERICGLNTQTQEKLVKLFSNYSTINKIVLYGSRAMGTYKQGSDIDLTVISEQMTLSELLKIENDIDDLLLPYKVDISLFQTLDNPKLIDHIQRVGVVFYQK